MSAWRQKFTEILADVLRFSIHGAMLLNGIIIALASMYLVGKLVFFFLRYLDRTIFAKPWG